MPCMGADADPGRFPTSQARPWPGVPSVVVAPAESLFAPIAGRVRESGSAHRPSPLTWLRRMIGRAAWLTPW